jgi:polyferredoxin
MGWYICSGGIMAFIIFVLLFILKSKVGKVDVKTMIRLLAGPIIKGVLFALLTGGVFILLMHVVAYYTDFEGIIATYSNAFTGTTLEINNQGRCGLTLIFSSLYVLFAGIKQAYKVS